MQNGQKSFCRTDSMRTPPQKSFVGLDSVVCAGLATASTASLMTFNSGQFLPLPLLVFVPNSGTKAPERQSLGHACAPAARDVENILASDEGGYPKQRGNIQMRVKKHISFLQPNNSSPVKSSLSSTTMHSSSALADFSSGVKDSSISETRIPGRTLLLL